MKQSNKNLFYILMILAMAGWGASWVNAKVLSNYINEYELVYFRNIFTLITLAPVLLLAKKSFKINMKSFLLALLASIIMIAYLKYFFLGTKFGTASLGGALVTTLIPINTFLIMSMFYGKKILKKDFFALLLGAIGVLTMLNIWSFSYEDIVTKHNLYFLLASILWPALTIVSSKTSNTSPMTFTLYLYLISTVLVVLFLVDVPKIDYSGFDNIFWINILCLAVIATTFATTIYFIGIEKLGTNEVSSFIFLVPLFAIGFSALFLKEEISMSIIIGTILTLISVKILNNITLIKKRVKTKEKN